MCWNPLKLVVNKQVAYRCVKAFFLKNLLLQAHLAPAAAPENFYTSEKHYSKYVPSRSV